ncbi:MAG: hypothetical protein ACLUZX_00375 [Subdoligranulum sp.]
MCIIEHFGNADAVPQPPERCLSRKAGIVRCCLKAAAQGLCSSLFMWDDFECAPRHLPPERVEVFPQRESQEHCRKSPHDA